MDRKPILIFSAKFAGFLLLASLFSLTPQYQALLREEVTVMAGIAHHGLFMFGGQMSTLSGATLYRGGELILEVESRCSGMHFCWLLGSAILAFPASMALRLLGVVVGSAVLLTINVVRIASLFVIGSYYPGYFQIAHEQIWPAIFLVITVLILGGWLICARKTIGKQFL